ncbi:MAG: alpha/beta fold hydrolase [Rhizobacter sp.]
MPIDVLFIHSAGPQSGDQGSSLFVNHLRRSLGAGFNLISPQMPAPDAPSYERWKQALQALLPKDRAAPPILIGHSLGGSVLLKYLSEERAGDGAAGLFVVASPYWGSPNWKVDDFGLAEGFARHLPSALQVHLYQSEDDEVVDIQHLSRYAKAIPTATVHKLDTGGHAFQQGLPVLVADIEALAKSLPRGT